MYAPDMPVSVAFGSLIVASRVWRRPAVDLAELRRVSLWQVLAYGLCFHLPDSLTAFVWYPDWNLAYVVPWEQVGWSGAAAMELGLLALLLLGRELSLRLVAVRRSLAVVPALVAAVLFASVMAAVWERYLHVGDYADYHAGRAVPGVQDAVFTMFSTLAGMYLIVPLMVLLAYNARSRQ